MYVGTPVLIVFYEEARLINTELDLAGGGRDPGLVAYMTATYTPIQDSTLNPCPDDLIFPSGFPREIPVEVHSDGQQSYQNRLDCRFPQDNGGCSAVDRYYLT